MMKIPVLENPQPRWLTLLLQTALIVPFVTFVICCAISPLVNVVWRLITAAKINLGQDLAGEVEDSIIILLSGFIAGSILYKLIPSFRATGRFVLIPAVILLVIFGTPFQEFMKYNARETRRLSLLAWMTDLNTAPIYGYIGYSTAMLICGACGKSKKIPEM